MLRSLKELERYAVRASDGEIGRVVNFLLDDQRWVIRYLVAQTTGFFDGRRVLISPISFREVDWTDHSFHVALTMDKVKNGPGIDADRPVSRQRERDYSAYYGYPWYWGSAGFWGAGAYPAMLAVAQEKQVAAAGPEAPGDVHLRSAAEVSGYHVEGVDGAIGHVDDFIVDDATWAIRYVAVDTSNWWVGKKVLLAPRWANRISWGDKKLYVDLSKQQIKDSPEWGAASTIDRDYEARLHGHYSQAGYWDSETPK